MQPILPTPSPTPASHSGCALHKAAVEGPQGEHHGPWPHLPPLCRSSFCLPVGTRGRKRNRGCLLPVLLGPSISTPPCVPFESHRDVPCPVSGGARFGVGGTHPLTGQLSSMPTFWEPRFPYKPGSGNTHLSSELGGHSPCVPADRCGCSMSVSPLPRGVPAPPALDPGVGGQSLLNPELGPVRPLPAPCLQGPRNPPGLGTPVHTQQGLRHKASLQDPGLATLPDEEGGGPRSLASWRRLNRPGPPGWGWVRAASSPATGRPEGGQRPVSSQGELLPGQQRPRCMCTKKQECGQSPPRADRCWVWPGSMENPGKQISQSDHTAPSHPWGHIPKSGEPLFKHTLI